MYADDRGKRPKLMTDKPPVEQTNELHDYWFEARRPLPCFMFLLPLLLAYEAGVLWLGGHDPSLIRNGADDWMRGWLQIAGARGMFLLPGLVSVGLLIWHISRQYPWRVAADTLAGMFAESLLFAFCLIVVGQLQEILFQRWAHWESLAVPGRALAIGNDHVLARMVTFIGAGIYEEVLFRLCLLPACYAAFRFLRLSRGWSSVLAVVSTSLIFSMAHYVGASGDQFSVFSFTFRTMAGLYFAALFVMRGFGITVGCHAAYDVLVGVILLAPE